MQVRSENRHDQYESQIKLSGNSKSGGKGSHPRKRASLTDLTNNNIKRTRKEAKKDVPAKKLNARVFKQHVTRSYLRKLSAIETQNPVSKSCGEISVFRDDAASDADVVVADVEFVAPPPRLPEGVRNFDNDDKPMQAYCYAADLHNFFFERENKFRPSMEAIREIQVDFTHQNRAMLLDWIIDVVQEFNLESETLFITVNLIDRALSKIVVMRGKLQLLGVACLNLAAKYTEDRGKSPIVEDLAEITDNAYKPLEILEMEKTVLQCLDFELSIPTVHAFLTRFLRCGPSNQQEGALAQYLSELFLMDLNMVKYKSSMVAASALCLARLLLHQKNGHAENESPLWDKNLEYHTQLKVPELHECVQDMHRHHCKMQHMQLDALREKYSDSNVAANRNAVIIKPLASLPFIES